MLGIDMLEVTSSQEHESTIVPNTLGGFKSVFYFINRKPASEQDIWDAAVKSAAQRYEPSELKIVESKPPKWYTRDEIKNVLSQMNYSPFIQEELSDWIVRHLQYAFNKGFQKAYQDKGNQVPVDIRHALVSAQMGMTNALDYAKQSKVLPFSNACYLGNSLVDVENVYKKYF